MRRREREKKKEERTSFRSDCACQRDGGHREGLNHEETDGIWDGCRLVTNEGRERETCISSENLVQGRPGGVGGGPLEQI